MMPIVPLIWYLD